MEKDILDNEDSIFKTLFSSFGCTTVPELYSALEWIAKNLMRLDHMPFMLSEFEDPDKDKAGEISTFIFRCMRIKDGNNAEAQVEELIKHLKENPPIESYENPVLPKGPCTPEQKNLAQFIYCFGIDLPGSKLNLYGHLQYFSIFFIDMFFGNFTEFNAHVNSLSSKELKKQLKKREGYMQYSPLFAPILGMVMLTLDDKVGTHSFLSAAEKKKIRLLYSGNNENKHCQILKKLLKLGADPNAHDIHGFTPLLHAMYCDEESMIAALLNKGADPNCECIYGYRPLTMFVNCKFDIRHTDSQGSFSLLLQHNGTLTHKGDKHDIRTSAQTLGDKDLIVRVRKAFPRDKEECEKCMMPCEKKCSACSQVYYCSPTCQKMDWKYHKLSCNKD